MAAGGQFVCKCVLVNMCLSAAAGLYGGCYQRGITGRWLADHYSDRYSDRYYDRYYDRYSLVGTSLLSIINQFLTVKRCREQESCYKTVSLCALDDLRRTLSMHTSNIRTRLIKLMVSDNRHSWIHSADYRNEWQSHKSPLWNAFQRPIALCLAAKSCLPNSLKSAIFFSKVWFVEPVDQHGFQGRLCVILA